ncbi:MAG: hypothetical protein NPIRA06_01820 [Nitrospirales bacterium]|nr:MAG: hypothetical protein NPIRA06_01820 [Nitrospirales bacterium]
MNINKKIKQGRLDCGLSDVELARRLGISIYEYGDIEFHDDELTSVVDLHVVRQLCQMLNIDPFDLLEISKDNAYADQKRNELIISQMKNLGISNEELADTIGFEVVAIEEMRDDPDFLEKWTFDLIKELAGALQLPIQSLLRL